jgi:hypothetical protein
MEKEGTRFWPLGIFHVLVNRNLGTNEIDLGRFIYIYNENLIDTTNLKKHDCSNTLSFFLSN